MAQIMLQHAGQSVPDFSVSGAVVTVAGMAIDCCERQADESVIIEVRYVKGVVVEGGMEGAYLAQIAIPARSYRYAAATAPFDVEGASSMLGEMRIPVPLDCHAIAITLWPAEQNSPVVERS
ncbi:MAG: hypothetical protein ACRCYV_02290 [Aeromonas sp.]